VEKNGKRAKLPKNNKTMVCTRGDGGDTTKGGEKSCPLWSFYVLVFGLRFFFVGKVKRD
jgi:hypothetical protein